MSAASIKDHANVAERTAKWFITESVLAQFNAGKKLLVMWGMDLGSPISTRRGGQHIVFISDDVRPDLNEAHSFVRGMVEQTIRNVFGKIDVVISFSCYYGTADGDQPSNEVLEIPHIKTIIVTYNGRSDMLPSDTLDLVAKALGIKASNL